MIYLQHAAATSDATACCTTQPHKEKKQVTSSRFRFFLTKADAGAIRDIKIGDKINFGQRSPDGWSTAASSNQLLAHILWDHVARPIVHHESAAYESLSWSSSLAIDARGDSSVHIPSADGCIPSRVDSGGHRKPHTASKQTVTWARGLLSPHESRNRIRRPPVQTWST